MKNDQGMEQRISHNLILKNIEFSAKNLEVIAEHANNMSPDDYIPVMEELMGMLNESISLLREEVSENDNKKRIYLSKMNDWATKLKDSPVLELIIRLIGIDF